MIRLLLAVIGMGLLLFGAALAVHGCSSNTASPHENSNQEPEVTTDIIVARLQEIQELASLRVRASGIVHASQPGRRFYHGTSRMVLLVRGEAIYSVDLAEARIDLSSGELEIVLPPPKITAAWVDVGQSRVWSRQRGRFREHHAEPLERACWEAAQELVHQAASTHQHRQTAVMTVEALIARIIRELDSTIRYRIAWSDGNEDEHG